MSGIRPVYSRRFRLAYGNGIDAGLGITLLPLRALLQVVRDNGTLQS